MNETLRRFRVQWAEVAARELEELVSRIARDSPDEATRILEGLRRRAQTLSETPQRGRVVPELAHAGPRVWRELIVPPWRMIYRIDGDKVRVVALLDGRRALEELLFERLIRSP